MEIGLPGAPISVSRLRSVMDCGDAGGARRQHPYTAGPHVSLSVEQIFNELKRPLNWFTGTIGVGPIIDDAVFE
jgi:hypothetical protein